MRQELRQRPAVRGGWGRRRRASRPCRCPPWERPSWSPRGGPRAGRWPAGERRGDVVGAEPRAGGGRNSVCRAVLIGLANASGSRSRCRGARGPVDGGLAGGGRRGGHGRGPQPVRGASGPDVTGRAAPCAWRHTAPAAAVAVCHATRSRGCWIIAAAARAPASVLPARRWTRWGACDRRADLCCYRPVTGTRVMPEDQVTVSSVQWSSVKVPGGGWTLAWAGGRR